MGDVRLAQIPFRCGWPVAVVPSRRGWPGALPLCSWSFVLLPCPRADPVKAEQAIDRLYLVDTGSRTPFVFGQTNSFPSVALKRTNSGGATEGGVAACRESRPIVRSFPPVSKAAKGWCLVRIF